MICGLVLNVVADAFIPHVVDFKNFKKSFVAPRCVMQACCMKSITHTGMCCNTALIYQVQNVPADISELWSIKKKGICLCCATGWSTCSNLPPSIWCGLSKTKSTGLFYGPCASYQKQPACLWVKKPGCNKRLKLQQQQLAVMQGDGEKQDLSLCQANVNLCCP